MTRMIPLVLKSFKLFLGVELLILGILLFSFGAFINIEVAFLSSFLIIMGSSYTYAKMVDNTITSDSFEEQRDLLDKIEDPYELYDENEKQVALGDDVDFKAIVAEEKKKIKTFNSQGIKYGTKGGFSLFRLLPYLFLILGFIALKNNNLLDLWFYMPSLFLGIVVGYLVSKRVFN